MEIKVPTLGESVTEATIAKLNKKEGDSVKQDEVIVELETDKVTLEVFAPVDGVLEKILCKEGDTVSVGDGLAVLSEGGSPSVSPQSVESSSEAPSQDQPQEASTELENNTHLSPAVQQMVSDHQLDPSTIQGTGPNGRILKEDVQQHLAKEDAKPLDIKTSDQPSSQVEMKSNITSQPSSEAVQQACPVTERGQRKEPMSRLRQRIAERLKSAQNTAAILTTFNEVDMSAIMDLRTRYKEVFEKKHGVKMGFMSFFIKAAVKALQEFPAVNAEISGTDLIYKDYCDIGVAVSAPQGLIVPIIRDAQLKSFSGLEKELLELGQKARDNKLALADLTGGTFTISNGGVFGSLVSTPILNPPQSAILGMHKIQERPVAIDGKVEIRPMMYLALSYDHRIIDGKEAVSFLVRIKENIENPERLLLEV